MGNLDVIDQFLQSFIRYIDSGFGLLSGNVAFLTSTLIGIDITLAGLFWVLDGDANVIARLIKKTLYIGAFAFILNNFQSLANAIFNSMAGLGLLAGGSTLTAQTLLQPGHLADTGFQAAWPLLQQAGKLASFTGFFPHFATIVVLVVSWFIVVLSFFVLAVQLFITILEFKLTTLAGFVLVPFALWNKSAFLAERVLGGVISAGLKVMMLAVIVGIGSNYFDQFVSALQGREPTLADAMSLVLASLALFGLGIFGPGIAAGLVSGAPQLGAGAVLGTGAALIGGTALAGSAAWGGAKLAGSSGLGALRAGTSLGSGAATAYSLGKLGASGESAMSGVGAGLGGVARAGGSAAKVSAASVANGIFGDSAATGARAAWRATGGKSPSADGAPSASSAPDWARKMRSEQRTRAHAQNAMHAVSSAGGGGSGVHPDLSEREH